MYTCAIWLCLDNYCTHYGFWITIIIQIHCVEILIMHQFELNVGSCCSVTPGLSKDI